jgi:hypothetical protein
MSWTSPETGHEECSRQHDGCLGPEKNECELSEELACQIKAGQTEAVAQAKRQDVGEAAELPITLH